MNKSIKTLISEFHDFEIQTNPTKIRDFFTFCFLAAEKVKAKKIKIKMFIYSM